MAVTFQHKIALCPGSVFCFGTISSVVDEEGTQHRISDLPERTFLDNLRESQSKAGNSATSSAPSEDYHLQARSGKFIHPKNPVVHLINRRVDTDCEKKRNKDPSSCPSGASALKGEQKEACRHDNSVLPQRPLYRGESGIVPHLR
jgi:hypothetical protein